MSVALDAPFTSYNPNTGHGSASDTNASITAATNSSFTAWDDSGQLVFDESFGSVEKLSDDPLAVRYAVADGVQWSDGVDVDAADLLLAWAANSRTLNDDVDPADYIDPETGLFTDDFPDDAVFFDGFTANALHLASELPEVSDDGRGITVRFDEHVADWQAVFTVGLPAHVVGAQALALADESPGDAKDAVVEAIRGGDPENLAALSRSWNSDFAVEGGDIDPTRLVGTGPYVITAVADGQVTLTANPRYSGAQLPRYETVEVLHIADPLEAVTAFEEGEVDVFAPQPSDDVLAALDEREVVPTATHSGVWDLLQVRFDESANDAIEDDAVREAFLRSIPRSELIDAAGSADAPATPRHSFTMMPGVEWHDASAAAAEDDRIDHDPRAASRLLREAIADGVVSAKPTVCVLFDPANPRRVAQFSEIRDAAASAGFTVTDCSSPDWRNLLGTPGAWDAALYSLRDRTLSVQAATAMFRSDSPLNHGRFESEDVERVLDLLEQAEDAEERGELRAQLDELLWQSAWGLPLAQLPSVTVVAPEVDGVSPSAFAPSVLHDVWRWRPMEQESAR